MKHFPILLLAAVLAVATSAPAQLRIEGGLGRHVRGVLNIGHEHHRRERCEPVCPPPAPRGHWETVHEQVLVPGYWQHQEVPPTDGWIVDHCGHRRWGIVDAGGCRQVWIPARWETRCRQVWVRC